MKTIQLKTIHLRNFKGAKDVKINLSQLTTIKGDNGTGKTTVFDAFNWLLWGKNSSNESSFEVKSLDAQNNYTHQQEHEVIGLLIVDGSEIELKRVYKEKWTKKRGSETAELTGHDTDFFVNDVPKSKGEYDLEIGKLLNPQMARLITDPLFFNVYLKWNERRDILTDIAGDISDESIIDAIATPKNDLSELINILNSGKSLSDKKKEVGAKKKLLKYELNTIPSRMDEVERSKPELKNWSVLKDKLVLEELKMKDVNDSLLNIQEAQQKKYAVISENDKKRFDIQQKIDTETRSIESNLNKDREITVSTKIEATNKLNNVKGSIASNSSEIVANDITIKEKRDLVDIYRKQWKTLNESPTVGTESIKESCPTCNGPLSAEKIETQKAEISKRANEQRVIELQKHVDNATKLNGEIQLLQAKNSALQLSNETLEKSVIELTEKSNIIIPAEMPFTESEILISLRKELESTPIIELTQPDLTELTERKNAISIDIQAIKFELLDEDSINKSDKRIFELTEQQKNLSQELANLEKIEIQIDQFNKAKIEAVESKVNSLFKLVKFKMYDQQINGGESPSCVCMVDGVPFSDLNTASKINAGLDIINALQSHYDVFAPVFIDNRESVTNILETNCQIINLVKVEGLTELIVE